MHSGEGGGGSPTLFLNWAKYTLCINPELLLLLLLLSRILVLLQWMWMFARTFLLVKYSASPPFAGLAVSSDSLKRRLFWTILCAKNCSRTRPSQIYRASHEPPSAVLRCHGAHLQVLETIL